MTDSTILEYDDDISTAEAPPPLPVGEYVGTITGAQLRTSDSGNTYVQVGFRVDPEQYPADYDVDNEPDGVTLYWRRVPYGQSQKERFRMRKFCETIGAPTGRSIDLNEWTGLEAKITVGHRDYEGEPRAEISHVNSVND